MTDAPKRRGRPPKVRPADAPPPAWASDPWSAVRAVPTPTTRIRVRAMVLQQAWQYPDGVQWRTLPVVAPDAPDWEDA